MGFLILVWKGLTGSIPVSSKISNRNTIPHMTEMTVVRLLEFLIQAVGLAVEI